MMTESRFDPVFDCQEVFKALMNAFAKPGKVFSIEKNVEKLEGQCASLTAAAMVLLDNWRSFYVEGDAALEEELREQTYGVPAAMDEADYLFFPGQGDPWQALAQAKPGTLPEPHKSATLFVLADSLEGGAPFSLTGPGVDGGISVSLPERYRVWLEARDAQGHEFPCGVDLYFLTPQGQVMGIPRKVKMGGKR